jgi:hypothetical protein
MDPEIKKPRIIACEKTMKNLIHFFVSIVLIFTFLFAGLPDAKACGPYNLDVIFSVKSHPDFPLAEFTNGKTGIVPDSFDRMSLFTFYRHLNNSPLTKEEQKQVVNALENDIFYRSGNDTNGDSFGSGDLPNYFDAWLAARAKVTDEKRDIGTEQRVSDGYSYFTNCMPDAFRTAAKTLEARIAKYGTGDNVKEWLKGQDAVFANCEAASGLPAKLDAGAPEWLQKDREYQIAAAQFYMGSLPEARASFEKIAADENSPWKSIAKLVAARTFIRQASFIESPDEETAKAQADKDRAAFLHQASDALENILKDNSAQEVHKSALRLLGLVKFRMIPRERQNELAEILARSGEDQNIYNDLVDYVWLLSFTSIQAEEKGSEIEQRQAEQENREYSYNYQLKLRDIPVEMRKDDLTDWIFTYESADGFSHAYDKWKETGKAQWFVAAIGKTDAKTAQLAEILSEADKIKSKSPAFATVRYHQIRLLLEAGRRAEAKQKVDEVIAGDLKNLPLSTQNKFLGQRMILAENLNDFLKYAQRRAAMFAWDYSDREEPTSMKDEPRLAPWETRTMFDDDAAAFLNEKLPLSVLREAALSPQLPDHLKKFLVTAVWTRAFIAGNQTIEREFAPLVSRYAKEFAPLFSKYAAATTPVNREAAALIAVLRYPVIQPYVSSGYGREDSEATTIDSIRGNWWCAEDEGSRAYKKYDSYGFKYPSVYPNFLTAAQIAGATREHREMLALGNSSTYLARRAVAFALKNPRHPSTPEILHLAVRSTRYGCTDENTGKFSKQAFDVLRKSYPNSAWTKRTPYWFGGQE